MPASTPFASDNRLALPKPIAAIVFALLCASVAPLAAGKTQPAPLPEAVLQAKTVYIENASRYAAVADRANDELMKWGRLQVVTDPASADIVFKLTARKVRTGSIKRADSARIGTARSTEIRTTDWTALDVTLEVTLPRSRDVLWEDTAPDSRRLVKELRKRIEVQEKGPAK